MSAALNSVSEVPAQVTVQQLVESRYRSGKRPSSWDGRVAGIDTVKTTEGQLIKLKSDGQQSPPEAGWTLIVTGGDAREGYTWTLYGLGA